MDMLLGTKGWRKFEWREVLSAPAPQSIAVASEPQPTAPPPVMEPVPEKEAERMEQRKAPKRAARMPKKAKAAKKRAPRFVDDLLEAAPKAKVAMEDEMMEEVLAAPPMEKEMARPMPKPIAQDKDWAGGAPIIAGQVVPVRVFPVPDYSKPYEGPRTDFRDTVYWAPSVKTNDEGAASVSFYLSDAVTSFRVFAEGVGASTAGRKEQVFKSNLPFSMNIKVPTEVSSGDRMKLPLTLTNETDEALSVVLKADFGELMKMDPSERERKMQLQPKERKSLVFDVEVSGMQGESKVAVLANAGGLIDAFERTIAVAPRGFPFEQSFSGQVSDSAVHRIDLGGVVKGGTSLVVKAYPSPVATMIAGMDGMLRQPYGCFEQASSSNYPNVMIMGYLEENGVVDPALTARSQELLDSGYQMLTGYESPKRGYEWFGGNPGHEALTAYGLLEFVDMKRVFGAVDQKMIDRTAAWLKSRRDSKGGFQRNPQALDAFGAASPEVTDAYITYSLSEAGYGKEIAKEIERQAKLAEKKQRRLSPGAGDRYPAQLSPACIGGQTSRGTVGRDAVQRGRVDQRGPQHYPLRRHQPPRRDHRSGGAGPAQVRHASRGGDEGHAVAHAESGRLRQLGRDPGHRARSQGVCRVQQRESDNAASRYPQRGDQRKNRRRDGVRSRP